MDYEVITADNLAVMQSLVEQGRTFDLVELDGPYMAGVGESWDELTDREYIDHYTSRLDIVRQLLKPWGVVFLFGYPEGCAEIKAWARETNTLHLRRWLHWYKQRTAHKGRKVETILFFTKEGDQLDLLKEFGNYLRQERLRRGWTLRDLGEMAGKEWWHRGGNFYYETGRNVPSRPDMEILRGLFGFNGEWAHLSNSAYVCGNYEGITDLDYIDTTYPEETNTLNSDGLRSKPVGLYLDLFRPCVPPMEEKSALVLYGGSGNAGVAAGALGFDVTIIEQNEARADEIRRNLQPSIKKWRQKLKYRQRALPLDKPTQAVLLE